MAGRTNDVSRCASNATNLRAQTARAAQLSSTPMARTIGSWSAWPRYSPATPYMPRPNTTLHSGAS